MATMTNDELMQYLRSTGALQGQMYGNSFQTGANDGYVIDWSKAPGQVAAQQAAVADPTGPGGFGYTPPADWTPSIENATYVPDWAAATKAADNGGFMADYGWLPMLLAGVGAGSGLFGGASGAAGAGTSTAGAAGSGAMSGWDFGPLSDSFLSGGLDPVSGMSLSASAAPSGWDFGPLSDSLMSGGTDPVSGMSLSQMQPGMLDALKNYVTQNPGTSIKTALQAVGALGSSALGAYASNKQTSALQSQADKYSAMGQPYRDKLAALYADPSSFIKSDAVQVPVQQGTNALMRSLSTSGNPWGSGNALQQGQDYATNSMYDKLGQEKDRLAGFGGLSSYNQAAPTAATNAIGSSAGTYNAIGSGIGNIFNPPQTAAQQMTALAQAMKGNYGAGY